MPKLIVHTDGGARGNPGPAAIGVHIADEQGQIMLEYGEYLGERTNNQAEYQAVVVALEKAKELPDGPASELDFYLDSELVVKQLNREYRVKDKDLAPLFVKVWNLSLGFPKVRYTHVRREQNKEADRLVNRALDDHLAGL